MQKRSFWINCVLILSLLSMHFLLSFAPYSQWARSCMTNQSAPCIIYQKADLIRHAKVGYRAAATRGEWTLAKQCRALNSFLYQKQTHADRAHTNDPIFSFTEFLTRCLSAEAANRYIYIRALPQRSLRTHNAHTQVERTRSRTPDCVTHVRWGTRPKC